MTEDHTYRVKVEREGKYLTAEVQDVPVATFAETPAGLDYMVRDALVGTFDLPADAASRFNLIWEWPDGEAPDWA
ncbi:hypothetical protein ACGFJ7_44770 [Actinoplanes sp. NPDC048988]|uniref:hypothetical protein n=1 Tax=Actinoplanes sp. NPDC048988 TaxID=3363901 RepID=UPI003724955D